MRIASIRLVDFARRGFLFGSITRDAFEAFIRIFHTGINVPG